jgi:hypothetical protein
LTQKLLKALRWLIFFYETVKPKADDFSPILLKPVHACEPYGLQPPALSIHMYMVKQAFYYKQPEPRRICGNSFMAVR